MTGLCTEAREAIVNICLKSLNAERNDEIRRIVHENEGRATET